MSSTQQRAVISFFVIMVTVLVVAGAVAIKPDKQTATTSTTTTPTTSVGTSSGQGSTGSSSSTQTSAYKDGTYQASGSYSTPEGTESIDVSITLQDGVVSASSVTDRSRDSESQFYNENFIGSYKSFVVGKKLNEIQLGIVAGSSLTPNGFNRALESIKQQAES